MSGGAIRAFSHIGICVSDLERSVAFYRDALGFTEVRRLDVTGEATETLLGLQDVDLDAVFLERDGMRIELLHYRWPAHRGTGDPRPMNALGSHAPVAARGRSRRCDRSGGKRRSPRPPRDAHLERGTRQRRRLRRRPGRHPHRADRLDYVLSRAADASLALSETVSLPSRLGELPRRETRAAARGDRNPPAQLGQAEGRDPVARDRG